jgi:hypothetical protein
MRTPRLRHRMHEPLAGGILAICQLKRIRGSAKFRRQSDREAHRLSADVAFDRHERPAVTRP